MQFLLTKNIIDDGDAIYVFDFSEVKKELEHVTAFEVQGEDITIYLDNYLSRKPNADELALIEDILAKYKELKESTELDRTKALKLYELSTQALAFEENVNKDMSFVSSVGGYHINGDRRTRSNLEDLITYSTTDTIQFRDYDNTERTVTKDQLKVMLKEHVINGQNLYHQKWTYEVQIKNATTIEELNAIKLNFKMLDFTNYEY